MDKWGPDVKIGEGTWRGRRAVNIGWRGRVCFKAGTIFNIHLVFPRAVMSKEREKRPDPGGVKPVGGGGDVTAYSPDLATPQEAADVDCNDVCAGVN